MRERLGRLFDRCVDWKFRPRSVVIALVTSGVVLIVAALSGFVAKFASWTKFGGLELSIDTASGTPAHVTNIATGTGVALIIVGLALQIWQTWREHLAAQRKRVLIVETRGLRTGPGRPLQADVPKNVVGHREARVLDFRQMYEADITDPELGLDEAHSLPGHIRQAASGTDRADFTLIYGGVAAVPYTFLTGVLVDDEDGHKAETHALELVKPGKLSPAEYDSMVGDLVNYLDFMAEPSKVKRYNLGVVVLIFLAIFFFVALALKKEFWKDVH